MLIKIILIGISICVISMFLKQQLRVYIVVLNIVFVISVILLVFDSTVDTIRSISELLDVTSSIGKMFNCLFKAVAVCILTKLSSDICKESGNMVVSDLIDLGGRITLLIISLPFIESVIKTAAAFVI